MLCNGVWRLMSCPFLTCFLPGVPSSSLPTQCRRGLQSSNLTFLEGTGPPLRRNRFLVWLLTAHKGKVSAPLVVLLSLTPQDTRRHCLGAILGLVCGTPLLPSSANHPCAVITLTLNNLAFQKREKPIVPRSWHTCSHLQNTHSPEDWTKWEKELYVSGNKELSWRDSTCREKTPALYLAPLEKQSQESQNGCQSPINVIQEQQIKCQRLWLQRLRGSHHTRFSANKAFSNPEWKKNRSLKENIEQSCLVNKSDASEDSDEQSVLTVWVQLQGILLLQWISPPPNDLN